MTPSLATDAATATAQAAGNVSLASLDNKAPTLVGGRVPVDGSAVTQPVSAASLPLPTGAATSALQGAGLPNALTAGGGVKTGLVDALPWTAKFVIAWLALAMVTLRGNCGAEL